MVQTSTSISGGPAYYAQSTPPTDTSVLWVDTGSPNETVYRYDESEGAWVPVSSTAVTGIDEYTTFGESDLSINHTDTEVSGGSVQLAEVMDEVTPQADDGSLGSNTGGSYSKCCEFSLSQEAVDISIRGDALNDDGWDVQLTLPDASTEEKLNIGSSTNRYATFESGPYPAGDYEIGIASTTSLSVGYLTSNPGFSDTILSVPSGNVGGPGGDLAWVERIRANWFNPPGTAVLTPDAPSQITAWDIIQLTRTGSPTVDVEEDDGSWSTVVSGATEYQDISDATASNNVRLSVTFDDPSQSLDTLFRRFVR